MKPLCAFLWMALAAVVSGATWTADNGNGTYTNPLFYDEFSDPDLIRVGEDFYLTGTTMHAQPGLPVLHSRDLVNWKLLGYAFDRLDLGPEFRLEGGRESYGQGIWAPCLREHRGTFHIFTNINKHTTQHFTATNPAGPWTRTAMRRSLHDLSVLFDDDGHAYAIWGYQDIHFARLTDDLTDIVPDTEKIIIKKGAGMGEGLHWSKIDGKYFIFSAWYEKRMRMPAARADRIDGPYEVNEAISIDEDFGLPEGHRMWNTAEPFKPSPSNPASTGRLSMHQGAIVDTPRGEWWGFSMMDANSVGRLTCLSPITWQDGWPYFGLPGNLGRTPRTWTKPATDHPSAPSAPYVRNDDFSGPALANVWQWNHLPDDTKWSLAERPGYLRLHALPAADFWSARNTLTQRSIGPESIPTAELDASGLQPGDTAGLALLNRPYAWVGVRRDGDGWTLVQFDQLTGKSVTQPVASPHVRLRAHCDYLKEVAVFSYSTDGKAFERIGAEFPLIFQLKTFQGVRYALFNFNTGGQPGGSADFAAFTVDEPHPRGHFRPIPVGKEITLAHAATGAPLVIGGAARFHVRDRGLGRVALETPEGFVSVLDAAAGRLGLKRGEPGEAETFQWTESMPGDLNLLSLRTHRLVRLDVGGAAFADAPGPKPDRSDGVSLTWR